MLQAACTGEEDMGGSALEALVALLAWYPAPKLEELVDMVDDLLQLEPQSRPSASALLEDLKTMAAQD